MFGGGKMKIYIKLFRYFCENKTLKISKKTKLLHNKKRSKIRCL